MKICYRPRCAAKRAEGTLTKQNAALSKNARKAFAPDAEEFEAFQKLMIYEAGAALNHKKTKN